MERGSGSVGRATKVQAYGDFLLRDHHCGVFPPDRNSGVSGA